MKIVSFKEFECMPKGTIFAPYMPCAYMESFRIKIDTGKEYKKDKENCYSFNGTLDLIPDPPEARKLGEYKTTQYTWDGSTADFQDYDMIAVLDPEEINRMIEALKWAKSGCEGSWIGDYE